jgi:hypothetical protein
MTLEERETFLLRKITNIIENLYNNDNFIEIEKEEICIILQTKNLTKAMQTILIHNYFKNIDNVKNKTLIYQKNNQLITYNKDFKKTIDYEWKVGIKEQRIPIDYDRDEYVLILQK